jgi:hypothetical protein
MIVLLISSIFVTPWFSRGNKTRKLFIQINNYVCCISCWCIFFLGWWSALLFYCVSRSCQNSNLIWIPIGLEFRKYLKKIKSLFHFFYQPWAETSSLAQPGAGSLPCAQLNWGPPWPSHPTGSRSGRGSNLNAATALVAGPPCHPHRLNPMADSWPHRTHAENPEAVETEPDSTPSSKNQNQSSVKKAPLHNPNEHHRFGAQTRDRIGLESKLPTSNPSSYK